MSQTPPDTKSHRTFTSSTTAEITAALAGRYAVAHEIGQGGMATVYLARDLKHDRHVALKVLKPEIGAVLGVERFLAEIRVTANLQHPNLLPLFDSGETNGLLFYVMPFVDGESLRAKLTREQQLPIEEAVRIATSVASALAYAHQHGVVHRDLKPENILLHAGQPVIADFGIALAVSNAGGGRITQTGLSLGTPQYMSPEQASGDRAIDGRSDIYSLAAVTYEMLSGEPPHSGPNAQAIIAKLLTSAPQPLRALRGSVPVHVAAAIEKGLAKLPADRFSTAQEFADALTRPGTMTSLDFPLSAIGKAKGNWRLVTGAAVGAVALLLGGAAVLRLGRGQFPEPVVRFQLLAKQDPYLPNASLAISDDGSTIVYAGTDSAGIAFLFLRRIGSEQAVRIEGTRGALAPIFSPDGQQIAFRQDGKLKRLSLSGGSPVAICDLQAIGASGVWSMQDSIYYADGNSVKVVAAAGGSPSTLLSSAELPGGGFRAQSRLPNGDLIGVFGAAVDGELAVMSPATRRMQRLGMSGRTPRYVDPGFLVYSDVTGSLWSVSFGRRWTGGWRASGTPQRIADDMRTGLGGTSVAVSRNGTIVYLRGSRAARQLVLVTRDQKAHPLSVPGNAYRYPRFSPDGGRIAYTVQTGIASQGDEWVYDIATARTIRLTFDGGSMNANWAPDGGALLYTLRHAVNANGGMVADLFRVPSNGTGSPALYVVGGLPANGPVYESQVTPDGKTIVFRRDNAAHGTGRDIWIGSTSDLGHTKPLVNSPFEERQIALSHDGHWLAYVSNASGQDEVYLRRLDNDNGLWPVSSGGGTEPRWGPNDRELLFRRGDSVYAVVATLTPSVRLGLPHAVLGGHFLSDPNDTQWDVSPDGKQFVFARDEAPTGDVGFHVILNWFRQPETSKH